jgi:hypothetical protein
MQTATPADLDHLTALVYSIRTDWEQWLIRSVLAAHCDRVALADLAEAAVRCARDSQLHTPKAITFRGKHWQGLETAPPEITGGPRCTTCGKIEARCLTERPGPDDHEFEPVR